MLKTGRHYAGWENLKIRGIEPDLERHSLAMSRADFFGLSLRIDPCVAEDLPLPTNSVDAVVSTCTLCTVDDPQKTLAEVKRLSIKISNLDGFVPRGAHRPINKFSEEVIIFD